MAKESKIFTTLNGKSKVLIKEVTNEDSICRHFKFKYHNANDIENWLYDYSLPFSELIERAKDSGWINDEDKATIYEWGKTIKAMETN